MLSTAALVLKFAINRSLAPRLATGPRKVAYFARAARDRSIFLVNDEHRQRSAEQEHEKEPRHLSRLVSCLRGVDSRRSNSNA